MSVQYAGNQFPESSSRLPQRRPHEANLTEGMGSVIAHATTAHLQALLALDLARSRCWRSAWVAAIAL